MERQQDIVLGAFFALLGLGAIWVASSYSGATGAYPATLGAGMAICGAFVLVRALLAKRSAERPLIAASGPFFGTVLATAIYVALIVPLGFFTSSLLLMIALPLALGFRRPVYLMVVAGVFIGLVWAVFTLLLEKPLPRELFLVLIQGG